MEIVFDKWWLRRWTRKVDLIKFIHELRQIDVFKTEVYVVLVPADQRLSLVKQVYDENIDK